MKTGIQQMTMSEYLQLPALSSGLCNALLTTSPMHAAYTRSHPDTVGGDGADVGTAIHDALLEGVNRIVQIDAPDWRTKDAKAQRDEARSKGAIPLLAHKAAQVIRAVDAAKEFVERSELKGIFATGHPERVMVWTEGNIHCKARPDWLSEEAPWILHVKTTQGSAEPESWIRNQLVPSGYDVAASFYERGLAGQSVFLVIEQAPPFGCSLIALDPESKDLAQRKCERAIKAWQECTAAGLWPGYPTRICYAEPKPWHLAEEEAKAEQEFHLGAQA